MCSRLLIKCNGAIVPPRRLGGIGSHGALIEYNLTTTGGLERVSALQASRPERHVASMTAPNLFGPSPQRLRSIRFMGSE